MAGAEPGNAFRNPQIVLSAASHAQQGPGRTPATPDIVPTVNGIQNPVQRRPGAEPRPTPRNMRASSTSVITAQRGPGRNPGNAPHAPFDPDGAVERATRAGEPGNTSDGLPGQTVLTARATRARAEPRQRRRRTARGSAASGKSPNEGRGRTPATSRLLVQQRPAGGLRATRAGAQPRQGHLGFGTRCYHCLDAQRGPGPNPGNATDLLEPAAGGLRPPRPAAPPAPGRPPRTPAGGTRPGTAPCCG